MVISDSFNCGEVLGLKFGRFLLGKPKMIAHIYFVDGMLIDCGQSRMKKQVVSATKTLPIEQIFVTHHHEDHTGNIREINAHHNCEVFSSRLCCRMMQHPPKLSFIQKVTSGEREAIYTLIPKEGKIETNRCSFDIIPIPGHAPDMVALHEPNKGWLFSADLFINSYIGYFLRDESIADQIASIEKVLKLDFNEMFCGHNPQLTDGKHKLAKKLDFLETFYHNVSKLHKEGYSVKDIFTQLDLKENLPVKLLSGGNLSKLNMVKSAVRDLERQLA